MPSEHCILQDVPHVEQPQQQPQVKLCSDCHYPLSTESINVLGPEAAIVCNPCRERICARVGFVDLQNDQLVPVDGFGSPVFDQDIHMPFCPPTPPATVPTISHHLVSPSSPIPIPHQRPQCSPPTTPSVSPQTVAPPPEASTSLADPHADVTRLRVRSHSQDCLYPGATFSGTQKSGRSSYEVSVTIVDVDFSSSFLCGYLRIRGLTDDWPELTTYFDAEIIGSRYGFLTDDWGANENEDMTHWARFPAFKKIKQELRGPRHTIKDRDRDCVFMRWKERFLVPDHRVRDINGASFAGFYYVCVEFNPQTGMATPHVRSEEAVPVASDLPSSKPDAACPHREPSVDPAPSDPRTQWNDESTWPDDAQHDSGAATMSGFYFHQNSEPYQQLSLRHVSEPTTGSFEFR